MLILLVSHCSVLSVLLLFSSVRNKCAGVLADRNSSMHSVQARDVLCSRRGRLPFLSL